MVMHDVRWLAPTPLWNDGVSASSVSATFRKPAILRFDNDAFMEEFTALLDSAPERLKSWVAQAETWREPMSVSVDADQEKEPELLPLLRRVRGLTAKNKIALDKRVLSASDADLKLYQPAQQRFYLVSAALVCKTAGLPDKLIDTGQQEKVTFVLRRLIDGNEYAFIAKGQGFEWQKIAQQNNTQFINTEERLPLFNLNYQQTPKRNRRVLAGLIPVARREAYLAAALAFASTEDVSEGTVEYSPLRLLFQAQVIAPWNTLIQQAEIQKELIKDTMDSADGTLLERQKASAEILKTARESIQTGSWYILLDFADFLVKYIPNVWARIRDGSGGLSADEADLFTMIKNINLPVVDNSLDEEFLLVGFVVQYSKQLDDAKSNLIAALQVIQDFRQRLETVETPYIRQAVIGENKWPDFLYPLTDPESSSFDTAFVENIANAMAKVLPINSDDQPELQALKFQPEKNDNNASFIIRCVYEQPNCEPFHPPIVSESSEVFQMAAFFDPDAPGRPIRIPMPMDISPAGLRKYQKNTSLVISDMLCGKIAKIKKLTLGDLVLSVLPWPFHKDLPNIADTGPCKGDSGGFGLICSLSIPIVTLVALVLMIIMVALFDIFFKWIPFLFMSLPIPGLKGKSG